ncbi:MAG: hypothetical protein WBA74_21825 [Cyclobacteriaceae bacterium]
MENNRIKHRWIGGLFSLLIPGLGSIYGRRIFTGLSIYLLYLFFACLFRYFGTTINLFAISLTGILVIRDR